MTGQLYVTAADRMMRAIRAIVREEFPRLTFFGTYEFQVAASDGTTADLSPTDPTAGLPSVVKVPLRLPAMGIKPTAGQKCLVTFVNGDPTRPFVLASDPKPTTTSVDASGSASFGTSASSVAVGGASGSSLSMGSASTTSASMNASSVSVGSASSATADIEATSVTVGTTAASIAMGSLPAPLAGAAGVIAGMAAIATFTAVLSTTLQSMSAGYSSLSTPQKTAFTNAVSALALALTTTAPLPAPAGIPTVVVKGC